MLIVLALVIHAAPIPLDATHSLVDGAIVESGKPVMTVKTQHPDALTDGAQIVANDNTPVFNVQMLLQNGFKVSTVEFPSLNRTFEARFPAQTTVVDMLKSYFKSKVIVGNRANLDGLTAYCAAKGLRCKDTRALMAREDAAAQRYECQSCRDAYRACQVARAHTRAHPHAGVTEETEQTSCEHKYRACSFGGEANLSGPHAPAVDAWPCGAPAP